MSLTTGTDVSGVGKRTELSVNNNNHHQLQQHQQQHHQQQQQQQHNNSIQARNAVSVLASFF